MKIWVFLILFWVSGLAIAFGCRSVVVTQPDGRQVYCQECCDNQGNCTTNCW